MRDMAATVSVAQRTLLSIIIYLREREDPMAKLMKVQKRHSKIKPIIVPATPKKLIMPKF